MFLIKELSLLYERCVRYLMQSQIVMTYHILLLQLKHFLLKLDLSSDRESMPDFTEELFSMYYFFDYLQTLAATVGCQFFIVDHIRLSLRSCCGPSGCSAQIITGFKSQGHWWHWKHIIIIETHWHQYNMLATQQVANTCTVASYVFVYFIGLL